LRVAVTGGAGFLGSHIVDKLVELGYRVIVIDNLSTGSLSNIKHHLESPHFRFVRGDLREPGSWVGELRGVDSVFHLAANPEVRHSLVDPVEHYHQNVAATVNVLEASRAHGVKHFIFASSSTVYGDARVIPTPEDHPLEPISVYGATKVAGEVLCATYARLYNMKCLNLRYANIVGSRLRHGVIVDFIEKLRGDKSRLEILGDGSQRKSYLYVAEAVEATLRAYERLCESEDKILTYNVGNIDWVTVREIADIVVEVLGLKDVSYTFKPGTPDGRGWPGDVKLMLLDIGRISRDTGWKPRISSREAVKLAAEALARELQLTS